MPLWEKKERKKKDRLFTGHELATRKMDRDKMIECGESYHVVAVELYRTLQLLSDWANDSGIEREEKKKSRSSSGPIN